MIDRKFANVNKPAFNVIEPFMGVMMVQLNREMCELLSTFISGVSYVEDELVFLRNALADPSAAQSMNVEHGPAFTFSHDFMNTYVLRFNKEMRNLLIDFITDIEGGVEKIIWAFHLALKNPEGPRDFKGRKRFEVQYKPRNQYDDRTLGRYVYDNRR